MAENHGPGALLAHYHPLPRGPRVCLRLVRPRDAGAIADLYAREEIAVHELSLARLVSFDPSRRLVLCATALLDARETVLGVGVIELDRPAEPTMIVVDRRETDGLTQLLSDALVRHAGALSAGRAA